MQAAISSTRLDIICGLLSWPDTRFPVNFNGRRPCRVVGRFGSLTRAVAARNETFTAWTRRRAANAVRVERDKFCAEESPRCAAAVVERERDDAVSTVWPASKSLLKNKNVFSNTCTVRPALQGTRERRRPPPLLLIRPCRLCLFVGSKYTVAGKCRRYNAITTNGRMGRNKTFSILYRYQMKVLKQEFTARTNRAARERFRCTKFIFHANGQQVLAFYLTAG